MDGLSRWDLVLWIVAAYAATTSVLVVLRNTVRQIQRGSRG
jgi:hypothetical protein